jgi:hypothetical protein
LDPTSATHRRSTKKKNSCTKKGDKEQNGSRIRKEPLEMFSSRSHAVDCVLRENEKKKKFGAEKVLTKRLWERTNIWFDRSVRD